MSNELLSCVSITGMLFALSGQAIAIEASSMRGSAPAKAKRFGIVLAVIGWLLMGVSLAVWLTEHY